MSNVMANMPVHQPGDYFAILCDDVVQAWRVGDDGRPEALATGDLRPGRVEEWGD